MSRACWSSTCGCWLRGHLGPNGSEGLAAVLQHKPDVVVLDLMLPDQSGYDVCK
jgi:CheY-like chemotaxis protein